MKVKENFMVGELSFNTLKEAQDYIDEQENKMSFHNEEEMVEFVIRHYDKFLNAYEKASQSSLTLLPAQVDVLCKMIEEESVKHNFHYNYHHAFNSLFKTFNINAAIRQFQRVVKDVELSDDKIERIYRKLEFDWVPDIDNALMEIEEFNRFISLLAS